jgi:uncharacterized membrane protein YkoI
MIRAMIPRGPLLALLALLVPFAAGGQEPALPDYERALEAVTRGDSLPLTEILEKVQVVHPGRVIEVELDTGDGLTVYEVELITPEGRLIEVEVDAGTGEILDYEAEDEDD